jgi:hypothetical protein
MWHKIFGFNKVPSFHILHQGYSHFPSGWEGVCPPPPKCGDFQAQIPRHVPMGYLCSRAFGLPVIPLGVLRGKAMKKNSKKEKEGGLWPHYNPHSAIKNCQGT